MNIKTSLCSQEYDGASLVEEHASLVKRIAYHLISRLPASVLVDDLIQAGMIGLLEAAKNFNSNKGASFETFAGIRIRGSMLDDIRKGDWTPRSVHKNSRAITKAIYSVENETGGNAYDTDIAAHLGVDIKQYHKMLNEVNAGKLVRIVDLNMTEYVEATDINSSVDNPYDQFVRSAFQKALATALTTLPKREAIVLSLYYDDDLKLREISDVLNVSESRVSQILSQGMLELKAKLRIWRTE